MAMNMVKEMMGIRKMNMLYMVRQKQKFGDQKEYAEVFIVTPGIPLATN
jgi:hypothetical protein